MKRKKTYVRPSFNQQSAFRSTNEPINILHLSSAHSRHLFAHMSPPWQKRDRLIGRYELSQQSQPHIRVFRLGRLPALHHDREKCELHPNPTWVPHHSSCSSHSQIHLRLQARCLRRIRRAEPPRQPRRRRGAVSFAGPEKYAAIDYHHARTAVEQI